MIDNKGYIGKLHIIPSTLCLKVFHIHLILFHKRHMLLGQYEQCCHSFKKMEKKNTLDLETRGTEFRTMIFVSHGLKESYLSVSITWTSNWILEYFPWLYI